MEINILSVVALAWEKSVTESSFRSDILSSKIKFRSLISNIWQGKGQIARNCPSKEQLTKNQIKINFFSHECVSSAFRAHFFPFDILLKLFSSCFTTSREVILD